MLHLQLRWDNLADTLLTALMLRSLWDMRLASVLGVIVSICPDDSKEAAKQRRRSVVSMAAGDDGASPEGGGGAAAADKWRPDGGTGDSGPGDGAAGPAADGDTDRSPGPSTLKASAETVRATLRSIGLAHVKFLLVGGDSAAEHRRQSAGAFRDLYDAAPPIGVTLVLTATFTSVWPFAEEQGAPHAGTCPRGATRSGTPRTSARGRWRAARRRCGRAWRP